MPLFSFFLHFLPFLLIFPPISHRKIGARASNPKNLGFNPSEKAEPGGILGQNPQILGLFAAQTLKIWGFFPPELGIFWGKKWEFQAQVSTGENPWEFGEDLGFIYNFYG